MRTTNEYRCILISPSDVQAEREAVSEVVQNWNAQVGRALGARIELERWESHATPDLAAPPQEVLNRQLLPECDFAIALFWSRLGTPTQHYRSGSDEEIRKLLEAGVRVLVHFSRSPIPQENLQTDQYSRLQVLRSELELKGLVGYYDSVANLREQVLLHMTSVVTTLLETSIEARVSVPTDQVLTATKPDLRVASAPAFAARPGESPQSILSVTIKNHSPVPVFVTGVLIELADGRNLFPKWDSLTHQSNSRRRVDPGDGFDFNFAPEDLRSIVEDPGLMRRAMVRDAIGRC